MPYCNHTDIEKRLPSDDLASWSSDADGNGIDEQNIDIAISDADSTINAYLRSRYTVPFTTTPNIIKRISVDLVIYNLAQRRYTLDMPESLRNRYKDTIQLLRDIQSGKMDIEDVPVTEEVIADIVLTNKTKADRMFGKDTLAQW